MSNFGRFLGRTAAMLAAIWLGLLSAPSAKAGTTNIEAYTSGYWQWSGNRNGTTNYITGGENASQDFYRSFQAFDIPAGYTFSDATVTLSTYSITGTSGTLELYDVVTDVATVTAFGGVGQVYIYDDLGTGTLLGSSATITPALANSTVSVDLNVAALAYLSARAGQQTVIGFRINGSLTPFTSSSSAGTQRLRLIAPAPTTTSVSAASGPVAGGNIVTVTGANFGPAPQVLVDTDGNGSLESAATGVTVNLAGTEISYAMPPGTAGAGRGVRVTNSLGESVDYTYTYIAAPTLSSGSPLVGPTTGGQTVNLYGTNLSGVTSVTFDGVEAVAITPVNNTQVTVTTPAGTAGLVDIVVTTPGGAATRTDSYTYVTPPTVTSISPNAGALGGGQTITITGTNLTGATAVNIGGTAATSVTVVNDTTVTAVTPSGTAGAKNVVITTPGGNATLANGFTYAAPPLLTGVSPSSGPTAGGQTVTLTGTNLTGATIVLILGVQATNVTVINSTTVTAVMPALPAGTYNVSIGTPGGAHVLGNAYTAVAAPTLTSLSPDKGTHAGGTSVTLTGTNLSSATSVTFDGVSAASFTVNSATSVTAVSPPGLAGVKTVSVTTTGGSANRNYVYEATVTSVTPALGPVSGGTAITVTGSGFTGLTGLSITTPDLSSIADATSFTVVNDSTITAVTPAMPAGTRVLALKSPFSLVSYTQVSATQFQHVAAPTITSLSQTSGPVAGGGTLTITGTNFIDPNQISVTIGGVTAGIPVVPTSTSIIINIPAGTAGAKDVVVTAAGGSATLTNGYTYFDAPALTAVSPPAGPLAGGQTVTLTGTGLTGATAATISGTATTSLTVVNDTTVTAVTPAGTAGAKDVVITTPGGTATLTNGYTYAAAPTLTSLAPSGGPTVGGNLIEVNGTNLTGATSVTFNGVAATNLTQVSATRVTVLAPPGAAGTADIAITTPGGTATLTNGFTYFAPPTLTSVSPASGPTAGGQLVILTGTNFDTVANGVRFGTQNVPYTINSATQITATAPAASAGTVDVSVSGSYGTIATLAGAYTFVAPPTLTAISPSAGPLAGGTAVTLTGTNFVPGDISVTIGGTLVPAASVTVNSATSLTFTTPANAAGNVAVSVTTSGGTSGNVPGGFTYADSPTVSSLSPALGTSAGGTSVTITGTNFVAGDTAVTIGGTLIPSASVTVNSATSLTFTTPANAAGNVAVSVTTSGGTSGTVPGGFTYLDPPTVTALSPTAGTTAGGTLVTITGTNFLAGDTSVTIGGNLIPPASVSVNSATSLTFTTPAHPAGNVAVSVTTSGGASGNVPSGFTYGVPLLALTAGDLAIEGDEGGAGGWTVTSGTTAYTVSNPGSDTLNWSATLPSFLSATPLGGSLAPNGSVIFTPTPNSAANALTPGVYNGTITVTSNGGTETRNVTLTVGDGTAPALANGPTDITVNTDPGSAAAIVTYATPTFTDNVGVTSVVQIAGLPSGASFPVGVTTNTFRASDAAGNVTDYGFTVTVADAEPPVLANVPANITISVDFPATTATASWTPPTASDNAPGVTVTRIAGPAPGSSFPLGTTTITYRASDATGNSVDASFGVTVTQTPPASVSIVVNSAEDGSFVISSSAPGLSGTIATSGGVGSLGPVAVPQGSYTLAFTTPTGFGVASASCTAGGTLDASSQTGTLSIASNAVVICTITTVDSLGETAAALGGYLETRASLIVQNAPEVSRRLDRLTGGGGAGGGISGFGVSMGAGVLPFSMSLGADELTFNTSLIGASRSGRTGLQPRQARSIGESIADPLGDHLFGLPGDRLLVSPLEKIRPGSAVAATGDALGAVTGGDTDPMTRRFDIWVEGRFARFDAAGGEGTFGILHFGADYLVTPNLLLGVGLQFDWLREDTMLGGDIDGQGYLAGPYLTARLAENLYLDLRAAWGTADTDVSPFGTYVDTVDSDRSLITGALIGDYRSGAWTIRPEARLTWYREETDAYTDSLNVAIPAIRVETGYLEFGPEIGYVADLEHGASLRPSLTLQGVWTFAQENTAAVPSNAPGLADTGLRGRAELGVAYQSAGFSLAIATYYDGIGDNDFEAWGGRIKFSLGF